MNQPYNTSGIQFVPGPPAEWARSHPSFFFASGAPTQHELLCQLKESAQRLSGAAVDVEQFDEWVIVASVDDWFIRTQFSVPENFNFQAIPAFPELGQNCTRPEFVVAAFDRDVIVLGPTGVHVVKGTVEQECSALRRLATSLSWHRAIAFRAVHA
jgi:hypothetical protein